MVEGGINNSQQNSDVFYGLPLWQEVANNLGGAMTGKDHPCANKPIVFGSFIQHLARPSYLPRPSELVSKCEIQTKVGQLFSSKTDPFPPSPLFSDFDSS